jgi:Xaa-Pro aminopeptidase
MLTTAQTTPLSEIETRINKLKARLAESGLDAALILQISDLFYFTGTIQQSHLYVPVDGEPLIMVRKDYERALSESPVERIIPIKTPQQLPELLRQHGYPLPRKLGMELDVVPANLYLNYQEILDGAAIFDVSPALRMIRAVKSEYEIGLIREAAHFSDQVADSMPEFLHEGITEIELAGLVEGRARKLGHQGIVRMRLWGAEVFYGHLMAGPSAAVPSYLASPTGGAAVSPAVAQGSSFRPIKRHEPVLLDYVFAHQGYLSDHTRIFSIGELPDHLLKAHEAMLKVQARVKEEARPGVRAGDVYETAVNLAGELGYADHFMGIGDQRIRFIGHGIGIELDEFPFLARGQQLELEQGMIIALEPKLIFPDVGVVGIENTHVVTPKGLEQLGQFNEQINIIEVKKGG